MRPTVYIHPLSLHASTFAIVAREKESTCEPYDLDDELPDFADPRIALASPCRELPMMIDDVVVAGRAAWKSC